MIRSWQAEASQQIELEGHVWPVVAQNDLVKALVDAAVVLDRAGGCLQVVLQRKSTGVPNEMVTVAAIVVWQDRTNARPQPETRNDELGIEPLGAPAEPFEQPVDIPVDGTGEPPLAADGEPVDETAVPAELRAAR